MQLGMPKVECEMKQNDLRTDETSSESSKTSSVFQWYIWRPSATLEHRK